MAATIIVENRGDFLFVEEGKEHVEGVWNLPCGSIEEGESPKEAAVREAREETGLEVELDRLVGVYLDVTYSSGEPVVNFVYSAEGTLGEPEPLKEDSVKSVEYLSIEDVNERELRAEYIPLALEDYINNKSGYMRDVR